MAELLAAVVGNVTVDVGETASRASEVRKTRAKPGAGTGIEHVLAVWSQATVVTFSVPSRRPSEDRALPSVYVGKSNFRDVCMSAMSNRHENPGKGMSRKEGGAEGEKTRSAYLSCPSEVTFGCYGVGQEVPVERKVSGISAFAGPCQGKNILDIHLRGRRIALARSTAANGDDGSIC